MIRLAIPGSEPLTAPPPLPWGQTWVPDGARMSGEAEEKEKEEGEVAVAEERLRQLTTLMATPAPEALLLAPFSVGRGAA